MEDKKNTIYHYCSVNTFYSIISNKTIRLSDVSKTNDYMEKKWAYKKILKAFSERLMKDVFFTDRWRKVIESIYSQLPNSTLALAACFSKKGDLLSEWTKYADDGTGVALGFDSDLLDFSNNDIGIFKDEIIYSEVKQNEKINKMVKKFLNEIDLSNKADGDIESILFYKVFSGLDNISSTMKNPAFKEEDEVRIVYPVNIGFGDKINVKEDVLTTSRKIEKTDFNISPIRFEVIDDNLVMYADLSFEQIINKRIIKEIILGPKCKLSETDIKLLLHIGNYSQSIEIKKSKAAYN